MITFMTFWVGPKDMLALPSEAFGVAMAGLALPWIRQWARRETTRLTYKPKVLDQPVTSEVRSSAEKWRKPVIANNFASDGARAKFQRPACSLRRVEYVSMFFECTWIIFMGQKCEKLFSGHMTSLTFEDPVVQWPHFKSS